MALNFGALKDEMAAVLGTGARPGDVMRTSIGRWINQACRYVAYKFPWSTREFEQRVSTVAPYSTGTATFTLGSATVTGSGTTWTTAMVGRKIALSVGAPYYRISAFTSTTSITIADVYAEATSSGSAYSIFQDEYDADTTTHSLLDGQVFRGTWTGPLVVVDQPPFDRYTFAGWSTGTPVVGAIVTSTTVGSARVRLSPVPDGVYRIVLRGLKKWVDMTGDSETYASSLPEDVEELILDRALRWAPKVEGSRRVLSDKEIDVALRSVWQSFSKRRYPIGMRRGIGEGLRGPVIVANTDGVS